MSENPRLKWMLVVLGVLAAAFVVKSVVLKGDSGSSNASPTITAPASETPKHAKKKASPTTTTPFPADDTFNGFETRNIFEPVIQVHTEEPAAAPVAEPTTTVPTTAPASIDPSPGQQVSVLDVFVENDGVTRVRVQVEATVYTLQGGDAFANFFRVVSLDSASGCGQFLFGDSPFQLCEGQQVIK